MDKKNTMLLTVIAVATLLVAVVGATFAFFAIDVGESVNNSKTTVTGSTQNTNVGSVALTGDETLTMNLTAADMSSANKGHTFFANTSGTATIDDSHSSEQDLVVGTAKLTGGDSGIKYECKAVYKVTYDDTDASAQGGDGKGNITWTEDDAAVLKLHGADSNVVVTEDDNYTSAGFKLSELKTAAAAGKTVNVTYKLTGGSVTEAKLQASLEIKNAESPQQDRLANKEFRVNLQATTFNCDTVAS